MFKYLTHATNFGAIYTIAASEENATYPVTNLQHQRLSKTWRTITDLTSVDITADLVIARGVDFVGLANHNFSAGVSLEVSAGTTTSYSNYSTTITYRAGSAFAILPATQTYQHWRIRITDPANAYGFLEAGYLLLGALSSSPRGIAFDSGISVDHMSDVNFQTSEGGAVFSDWINDRKRISVSFSAMNRSERDTLLTFVTSLREETNPLFIIPEHTRNDGWYVRLSNTANEKTSLYSNVGPLIFMEEGSGKIMAA